MDTHLLVFDLLDAAASVTKRLDRSLSGIKGISFSEFQILQALASTPTAAATRVDLADAVAMSASGVTRALKPLGDLGFVETQKDARDARRSLASLTPAGVELVNDAAGVVADVLGEMDGLAGLSADDVAALRSLIDRINA